MVPEFFSSFLPTLLTEQIAVSVRKVIVKKKKTKKTEELYVLVSQRVDWKPFLYLGILFLYSVFF